MKTTRIFALATAMLACTFSASAQSINETRNLEPFSMVSVGSAMNAKIKYGETQSVVVTANPDIIGKVKTEVRGPELVIWVENDKKSKDKENKKSKMEVVVTIPVLNSVKANVASDVDVEGFSCDCDFFVQAAAASEVEISDIKINGMLTIDASGASDIDVEGSATKVVIISSGASGVNAKHVQASSANVKAAGASNVKVFAQNEIRINSDQASDVDYYGHPKVVDVVAANASSVNEH